MLVVRTRHGLVLAIAEPNVGSSRTHHTSPRRGVIPRLSYVAGKRVELSLYREDILSLIRRFAGLSKEIVTLTQLCIKCLSDESRPISGGDAL